MQLTADIFGLPTARPHIYETSALGAAMDAAVGRRHLREPCGSAGEDEPPGGAPSCR